LIHDDLVIKVQNNEGHLERAEYYCHKCGKMMTEISEDLFKCNSCKVSYDTEDYKFTREFKHLRRKDYPIYSGREISEDDDENLPF
jgi:ribosomal protein L37AE/L43A